MGDQSHPQCLGQMLGSLMIDKKLIPREQENIISTLYVSLMVFVLFLLNDSNLLGNLLSNSTSIIPAESSGT